MDSRFSNVLAIIPTRFECQMWVKFPGVEFFETAAKFRKRKKNPSSSCVYVLPKTSYQEISRRGRAVAAKKCTKREQHVRNCCFSYEAYCFFDVLVAVAVVVSKAPYCIQMTAGTLIACRTGDIFLRFSGERGQSARRAQSARHTRREGREKK